MEANINNIENTFYKDSIVLLQGAMINLNSQIELMRKYRIVKGFRDPVVYTTSRIKSEESMKEKLKRKNLDITLENALTKIYDAVGIRIVCSYIDDIYMIADMLKKAKDIEIIKEKDYIKNPKQNGYRSYHIIAKLNLEIMGKTEFVFAEIQIRTIAQDCWASLEHELKYKKAIEDQEMIIPELRRCADEIATTDLNMQAIKDIIESSNNI